LFEQIVRQCVEVGLVQGKHLSVDGSFVEANAAKESRIPREQLAEAAQVNQTARQYLVELEQQNPIEEPVHQPLRPRRKAEQTLAEPDGEHFYPHAQQFGHGIVAKFMDQNHEAQDDGDGGDGDKEIRHKRNT